MDAAKLDPENIAVKKYHLDFLYKAIDDCQNIIKLVDTKAAVSLAPLGFILNKLVSELDLRALCLGRTCLRGYLVLMCGAFVLVAAFQAYKVLFPLVNPVEHVDLVRNLEPAFFLGKLSPKKWQGLFSGGTKFTRFTQKFADYESSLLRADEDQLKKVLIGELIKISYIRDMKMFRLRSLGILLIASTLTFLGTLSFRQETKAVPCTINNISR